MKFLSEKNEMGELQRITYSLYHISMTDARATCKFFWTKATKIDIRAVSPLTDFRFCGTIMPFECRERRYFCGADRNAVPIYGFLCVRINERSAVSFARWMRRAARLSAPAAKPFYMRTIRTAAVIAPVYRHGCSRSLSGRAPRLCRRFGGMAYMAVGADSADGARRVCFRRRALF